MRHSALPAALLCGLAACSDAPSAPDDARLTPAAAAATYAKGGVPVPGRYIVRFRNTAASSRANADVVRMANGGKVEREFSHALNGAVMELTDTEAARMRSDVRILAIEQDQVMSVSTVQGNATWGLDRIDQRARPLNASYAYNVTGSGVTAYIIDTGINFAQADFGGRASTGFDAITAGGTAADCNGHGTHTAGTVGSTTYGVAKAVRLVAVRVLDCAGNGTTSGVIAGIDWVTRQGARPAVANMSLGGGYSPALNAAVQNSIAAGVTYAISAGNSAADACSQSPASVPTGITVGATSSTDGFASFSNYGSCVHLNAPGVNITSLWIGASGATTTISGTSMAAPHVAGVAALYLHANPAATPAQVRTALTANATTNLITGLPAATPNLLLYGGFIGAATPSAPVASFTASCVSLTCTLDASATQAQSNATYSWSFGDATSGSGRTASHAYAAAGTYSVTLTVSDAGGSNAKASSVTVTAPVNAAPTAAISSPAANASVGEGTSLAFSGSATDPEDGALSGASLVWTSSRDGQIGTGASFAKSNLTVGTHVITLTAKDSKGTTAAATRTITVTAAAGNQPPVASFTWHCNTGYVRQCAMDATTSRDDVSIASYTWDWGNGRTETKLGPTAKNTWAVSGSYVVTLKVTDGAGLTNSIVKTIVVP